MWWPSRRPCAMPKQPIFITRPEKKAALLDAIAATMPYELACDMAGISQSTFYEWKALGEQGKSPYAEFLEELRAREAEAVFLMHQDLKAAGVSGNINAIIFLLKARFPQHYSETQRMEHTGVNGGPIPFTIVQFGDDDHGGGNRDAS